MSISVHDRHRSEPRVCEGHKYATQHGLCLAAARHCFERLLPTSKSPAPSPGATVEMAESAITGAALKNVVDDLYQM